MDSKRKLLLVINGGSSSIKFAVFDCFDSLQKIPTGKLEGIGSEDGLFSVADEQSEVHKDKRSEKNYTDAINLFSAWLKQFSENHELLAAGHRMVHGGHL